MIKAAIIGLGLWGKQIVGSTLFFDDYRLRRPLIEVSS